MSGTAEELAEEVSLHKLKRYFIERFEAEVIDSIPPEELKSSAYSECYEKWEIYGKLIGDMNSLSGGEMVIQNLFLKFKKSTAELFAYQDTDFSLMIQEFYKEIGFPLQEESSGNFKCVSDEGLLQFVIYTDYIEHFCFIRMVAGT